MTHFKDGIDFIVVSYYRPEYIKLLIRSIKKYVDYPYQITIIANEQPHKEEYIDLVDTYEFDKNVNVIEGTGQVSFEERGGIDGVEWNTDSLGYKYGPGSVNHCKGLTMGMKNTDKKYICFLDNDTVFLDSWTDYLLPLLDDTFLISHRMDKEKGPQGIVRDMFMLFKRENFEKYNLYPNCEYVDGSGNITKCLIDNKEDAIILQNSLMFPNLKDSHVLKLRGGEQAFIEDKPFFYHYGRGSSRGDDYYEEWVTEVTKYLEI